MMNFTPKATEQYHSDAGRIGASEESDFDVSTFSDVHAASRDMMLNEGLSTSEARIMTPRLDEQLNLIYEATGSYPGVIQENTIHGFSRDYKERMLDENKDLLTKLHAENPETGFKTLDGILTEVRAETRVVREKSARTMLHAEGVSSLGAFTGTMRAVLEDPFIIGSMVASALVTKGAGGTAASRAFGIAKTEAAIGAISETMIQPSVYAWKKRIDSPYSVEEAAMNIMIAGGMGAVLGGGGSYIFDPSTLGKAAKLKDKAFKAGDKAAKHEAEILRKHADDLAVKPDHADNKQHFDAMDKATSDIEEGIMPSVSKVVEEKIPVDADVVQLDGVSTRSISEIAMHAEREGKIGVSMPERRIKQLEIDVDQRIGERRVDVGQRKRVADMTPKEMQKALLTSEKTVIRSGRAYEEDTVLEFQSFFDIDDFKEMNTRMTYEGADKVINEIGQVMKAEAGELNIPYHIHGDEFITQSSDEAVLKAYSKRVQDKLSKTTVEIELPDGKILKTEGVGISYGVGKTREAAEETLTASKAERKAAGIRKGARGKPDELRGQAARRYEDKISDDTRVRTDAEPRPKPVHPDQILPEDMQLELKEFDSQIEALKQTDLDVPIEQIVDAEGNIQVVTKKVSELLDEIELDEKSLNDVIACYGGV